MRDRTLRGGAAAPRQEDVERAVRAWQRAEADATQAEGIAASERDRARAARWNATERRRRAHDALAARQTAFARGLLDAALAHERAEREAEERALQADRRAQPLRQEADARRGVARYAERLWRGFERDGERARDERRERGPHAPTALRKEVA